MKVWHGSSLCSENTCENTTLLLLPVHFWNCLQTWLAPAKLPLFSKYSYVTLALTLPGVAQGLHGWKASSSQPIWMSVHWVAMTCKPRNQLIQISKGSFMNISPSMSPSRFKVYPSSVQVEKALENFHIISSRWRLHTPAKHPLFCSVALTPAKYYKFVMWEHSTAQKWRNR